jgi:hypothetical protein
VLANILGTIKAIEHTAKLVEEIKTTINNPLLWIIGFANCAQGDLGLFCLPYNHKDKDPFQGPGIVTSSI